MLSRFLLPAARLVAAFLIVLAAGPAAHAADPGSDTLVYEGGQGIGAGKHIVLIANDHEYRSEQTTSLLAKILAHHHGFRCTVLFGVNDQGEIHPGAKSVPGMEALEDADLLFFFTRFMDLPASQVQHLVDYFERGGPVVGVRTSTHAFNGQGEGWEKLNYNYAGEDYRGGLGEQVFGNTWHGQRGQSHYGRNHVMGSRITAVDSAAEHPILRGVGAIHAYSGAYKSQLPQDATPLLDVQVLNTFQPSDDIKQDSPAVNAGWTRDHYVAPSGETKQARVVYTSLGASEDLLDADARRLLVNACLWALGMEAKIVADLDVSVVGDYAPTPYTNGMFYYEGVRPSDLQDIGGRIMPPDAPVAGMTDDRRAKRRYAILRNRPEMRQRLEQRYPDLLGDNSNP
ncbi:ThuA domain-containing protein [Roseimaritima sediminicola]|uniref:ThuA domain-containing protein n=1 Tax=Roseimaritima sediminicola TaxID=2662066 RepID=UPI0012985175|nr:ThuA domain-containing protein [Roseimaritima sediminicola]